MRRGFVLVGLMAAVMLLFGGATLAMALPDQASDRADGSLVARVAELEASVAELEALLEGVTREANCCGGSDWLSFDFNIVAENVNARDDVAAGGDLDSFGNVFADVDGDGFGVFYGDCATAPIPGCSGP